MGVVRNPTTRAAPILRLSNPPPGPPAGTQQQQRGGTLEIGRLVAETIAL